MTLTRNSVRISHTARRTEIHWREKRRRADASFRYPRTMAERDHNLSELAPLPDYNPDGVDLSLIRWSLDLTPAERLEFLEDRIADILRIRALNAGA